MLKLWLNLGFGRGAMSKVGKIKFRQMQQKLTKI